MLLYFGSFDPIHNGHIALAEYALDKDLADEVALFRSTSTVKMIWESLVDLVSGKYSFKHISGPVGVTQAITEAARTGIQDLLYLAAVICINLGIFNLIPIPALDGGRAAFLLVEVIRRKPLSPKIEGYIHTAGLLILLLFMVIVSFKDVFQLIF